MKCTVEALMVHFPEGPQEYEARGTHGHIKNNINRYVLYVAAPKRAHARLCGHTKGDNDSTDDVHNTIYNLRPMPGEGVT